MKFQEEIEKNWAAFRLGEAGENNVSVDIIKRKPFILDAIVPRWKKKQTIRRMGERKCIFCRADPTAVQINQLHYTNVDLLHKFINERGMILNRKVTQICRKHQKVVEQNIKMARILGLLSPISNWKIPSYFRVSKMVKRPDGVIPPRHPLAIVQQDELEEVMSVPDPRFMPKDDALLNNVGAENEK